MIKSSKIFVVSAAVLCAYVVSHAYAVGTAPAVLSQYGQIQAVKNYSSNPFWNPNSPYNMKNIPKPIYVTGADLTTADCNRIVEGLVSDYCSMNNNCADMQLSDVRPYIMVTLSQLPGHNYATACGGYIDSAFDKYAAPTQKTLITNTTTNTTTNHYTFQNPYAPKLNAYQAGVQERTKELEQLQAQTGTSASLSATSFPKTVADLTLTDRMANAAAGYEKYKDKSAYQVPKFEREDEFMARMTCSDPINMTSVPDCKCRIRGAAPNDAGYCVCPGYGSYLDPTWTECPTQGDDFGVFVLVEGEVKRVPGWNKDLYFAASGRGLVSEKEFAVKNAPIILAQFVKENNKFVSSEDSDNDRGEWMVWFSKTKEELTNNSHAVWLLGDSKCVDNPSITNEAEKQFFGTEPVKAGQQRAACYCRIKKLCKYADYPPLLANDYSYSNSDWVFTKGYDIYQDSNDTVQIVFTSAMDGCKSECTQECVKGVGGGKAGLYPTEYLSEAELTISSAE